MNINWRILAERGVLWCELPSSTWRATDLLVSGSQQPYCRFHHFMIFMQPIPNVTDPTATLLLTFVVHINQGFIVLSLCMYNKQI